MTPISRIFSSFLASAIADALGEPTEFMGRHEIDTRAGTNGVRRYLRPDGGHISDDTQMLLFTAEAMLDARTQVLGTGSFDAIVPYAYRAYRWWLKTQDPETEVKGPPSALFAEPLMHQRRAPGNTCMSALRDPRGPGSPFNTLNDSKGCGTVMRIAPVGMVFRDFDDDIVFRFGVDVSAITHSHPTAYLSGGALALIVKYLVNGASLQDAITAAYTQLARRGSAAHETGRAIERGYERGTSTALSVAMLDTFADDLASMSRGNASGGWTAEDALALAIAATAACNGNTMDAIATCAAITGDSDSVASIAGTLCGAAFGIATIDAELIEGLCEMSVVRKMAEKVGGNE